MNGVQATLLALQNIAAQKILVVNAPADGAFMGWLKSQDAQAQIVQPFYPAAEYYSADFEVVPRLEAVEGAYDLAIVFFPKNKVEGHYALARAFAHLEIGGTLMTAAANKEGGTRLKKLMQAMSLDMISDISKNKAKALRGVKPEGSAAPQDWIDDGAVRAVSAHDFMTQAGLYGWNKIDKGSQLLLERLPHDLKGRGADFGCGYGLIARHVLEKNPNVKLMHVMDADARAVEICTDNLAVYKDRVQAKYCDLTRPQDHLRNLDFIVMNPPFHEGKKTDFSIGLGFIKSSAAALSPRGVLYVVANAHLPYEDLLQAEFKTVEKLHEGGGFKVFTAHK